MTPMAKMLAVLNGAEVARRLGVSRNAVSEWARTDSPPPVREAQVRELMRTALGEEDRASWPDWARALDAKMDAILKEAVLADSLREALRTTAQPDSGEVPHQIHERPEGGR